MQAGARPQAEPGGLPPAVADGPLRRAGRLLLGWGNHGGYGYRLQDKEKPRAQRYKEGDVFAIPLAEDLYAFGRIMRDPVPDGYLGVLVEIFRETSSSKKYRPSITASGRLLHPSFEDPFGCLKNRRWTVIASDDAYKFPEADEALEFLTDIPRSDGVASFCYGGEESEIPLRHCIRPEQVLPLVREFFETDARPTSVEWEEV